MGQCEKSIWTSILVLANILLFLFYYGNNNGNIPEEKIFDKVQINSTCVSLFVQSFLITKINKFFKIFKLDFQKKGDIPEQKILNISLINPRAVSLFSFTSCSLHNTPNSMLFTKHILV